MCVWKESPWVRNGRHANSRGTWHKFKIIKMNSAGPAAEVQELLAMLWPQELDFPSFCYPSSECSTPNGRWHPQQLFGCSGTLKKSFFPLLFGAPVLGCKTWEHCWKLECFSFSDDTSLFHVEAAATTCVAIAFSTLLTFSSVGMFTGVTIFHQKETLHWKCEIKQTNYVLNRKPWPWVSELSVHSRCLRRLFSSRAERKTWIETRWEWSNRPLSWFHSPD